METTDFTFRDEGTIVYLRPLTDAARAWVSMNLQRESWQDPDNVPIDQWYFWVVAIAIRAEGLVLRPS